jgi:hypothetical protein
MQFRSEVQEQFRKAGWFPKRDVRSKFDKIAGFSSFPGFLKEFLYEYGDLEVPCLDPAHVGVTGILNLKALPSGYFKLNNYLTTPRSFGGNLHTFPIGYYLLDAAALECDANGKVYMVGDFPTLMAASFKEGIERIIMEDYSESLGWDEKKQEWTDDSGF